MTFDPVYGMLTGANVGDSGALLIRRYASCIPAQPRVHQCSAVSLNLSVPYVSSLGMLRCCELCTEHNGLAMRDRCSLLARLCRMFAPLYLRDARGTPFVALRSAAQRHGFNQPYQLGTGSQDRAANAQSFLFYVRYVQTSMWMSSSDIDSQPLASDSVRL